MTYNFDPDKWYAIQRSHLETLLRAEKISQAEFVQAVRELDAQLDEMWLRLDHSYQIHRDGR